MHPHYHARVPSLGSTARVHVNPIDGYQCSNELRAQLNLTKQPKKKVTTPVKHVLLPGVSCEKGCGQSLEITERVLTRLQSTIP